MWKLSAVRVESWLTGLWYRQRLTEAATVYQAVIDPDSMVRWADTNSTAKTNREAVGVQVVPKDAPARRQNRTSLARSNGAKRLHRCVSNYVPATAFVEKRHA
jgi:hypothetical protein